MVLLTILGGGVLINGTGYKISSGKTLINGTGYTIPLEYTWKKYSTTGKLVRTASGITIVLIRNYYVYSVVPNYKTKTFSGISMTSIGPNTTTSGSQLCSSGSLLAFGTSGMSVNVSNAIEFISSDGRAIYVSRNARNYAVFGTVTGAAVTINNVSFSDEVARGDYIETVVDTNISAYPTNGVHTDGYWYVLQQ